MDHDPLLNPGASPKKPGKRKPWKKRRRSGQKQKETPPNSDSVLDLTLSPDLKPIKRRKPNLEKRKRTSLRQQALNTPELRAQSKHKAVQVPKVSIRRRANLSGLVAEPIKLLKSGGQLQEKDYTKFVKWTPLRIAIFATIVTLAYVAIGTGLVVGTGGIALIPVLAGPIVIGAIVGIMYWLAKSDFW